MDPVRIFLVGMASGGCLTLLVIRAEMWWNARKARQEK